MALSASYSKWDKLVVEEDHDQWEDPMSMPVCSEIPWQQVTPLMNKMLHEEYAAEDAALGPAPTRRARTDPMAQPPRLVSPPPSTPSSPARPAAGPPGAAATPAAQRLAPQAAAAPPPGRAPEQLAPPAPLANAARGPPGARARALKGAGNAALRRGRLPAALEAWREAEELALESGDPELWAACRSNAVLGELRRGEFAAAEQLATELLERFPRHEKGLYRRGLARESLGDVRRARQDFARAVGVNFMNAEAQEPRT